MGVINVKPKAQVTVEALAATKQQLIGVVQSYMDKEAKTKGYDSILSLCSYATSVDVRFSAEGQAGVNWRDEVWTFGYALLNQVETTSTVIPTEDELIGMLPPMVWPVV
jgi:hypothetical protein